MVLRNGEFPSHLPIAKTLIYSFLEWCEHYQRYLISSHTQRASGLTQVFGGFIAYGISFDDDHLLAPYKIIYILLGGLAILVGIVVIIWLPDSPVTARMLTKEERIAALERVRDDQGGTENKKWKKDQIIEAFTDIRTWLIALTTVLSVLLPLPSTVAQMLKIFRCIASIPNGALSNCEWCMYPSFCSDVE